MIHFLHRKIRRFHHQHRRRYAEIQRSWLAFRDVWQCAHRRFDTKWPFVYLIDGEKHSGYHWVAKVRGMEISVSGGPSAWLIEASFSDRPPFRSVEAGNIQQAINQAESMAGIRMVVAA